MPTSAPKRVALIAFCALLVTLVTVAFATAPAGTSPAPPPGGGSPDGPKFSPPYRPAEGKRDTFTIECEKTDPTGTSLRLFFHPWDNSIGYFGLDDVHGEYDFAPAPFNSGSSWGLPNRQGMKLTFYSGVADDSEEQTLADHPGAKDGVYVYNIVHGRCDVPTPPVPPVPPTPPLPPVPPVPPVLPVPPTPPVPPVLNDEVPDHVHTVNETDLSVVVTTTTSAPAEVAPAAPAPALRPLADTAPAPAAAPPRERSLPATGVSLWFFIIAAAVAVFVGGLLRGAARARGRSVR